MIKETNQIPDAETERAATPRKQDRRKKAMK